MGRTERDRCAAKRRIDDKRRAAHERQITAELPAHTRRVFRRLHGDPEAEMRRLIKMGNQAELERARHIWTVRLAQCRAVALDELRAPALVTTQLVGVEMDFARLGRAMDEAERIDRSEAEKRRQSGATREGKQNAS